MRADVCACVLLGVFTWFVRCARHDRGAQPGIGGEHPMKADQIAQAGQPLQETRDALVEQALQLIASGRTRLLEDRFALDAPIYAIEHQAVQMDVQVGGRVRISG